MTAEKSPMRKPLRWTATSGARTVMASEKAPKRLFMATPMSITVPREAPKRRAPRLTAITAAKAPAKAARESLHPPMTPAAAQAVTARPAPAFTPMTLGEARPFESTPCMTAPETASAAPERRLPSTRGILAYQRIRASGVLEPIPARRAPNRSPRLSSAAPNRRPVTAERSVSAERAK